MKMLCIFLASASCALGQSWTGWHAQAWSNYRLQTAEVVTVSAVVNGPFVIQTYAPPYPSTNALSETNTFLSDITFTNYADASPITNLWTFTALDTNGTPVSVVRTNIAAPTSTNLHLQARDILALDSYLACLERWMTAPSDGGLEKPRLYRGYRDALTYAKSFISQSYYYFLDEAWATPANFTSGPYVVLYDYAGYPTNFLSGFPSNYFYFTPWRELHLSEGYGRIITGAFTISTSSTNAITNMAYNSCGDLVTVIGTNGQQITFTCTNAATAEGFTSGDYGWGPITSLFARLRRTSGDGSLYGDLTYGSYFAERTFGGDSSGESAVPVLLEEYAKGYAAYPWIDGTVKAYANASTLDLKAEWDLENYDQVITAGWLFHMRNARPSILLSTNAAGVAMETAYVYTQDLEHPAVNPAEWFTGVPPWSRTDYSSVTGTVLTTETITAPGDVMDQFGNEQTQTLGVTGALFQASTVYGMSDADQSLPQTPGEDSDSTAQRRLGGIEVSANPYWIIKWDYKYK